MHLDKYGLPVQADGDANDQLQRVSMIAAAHNLSPEVMLRYLHGSLSIDCIGALIHGLQPKPGVYVRHVGGDPANVSADQLVSATAAHVALGNTKQVLLLAARCLARLGFAQNYKDGLSGKERIKLPDFMLLRGLPLFLRGHWLCYPLAVLFDALLVLAALSAVGPVWRDDKGFSKRSPDDVDDNVTILTLAVCRYRMPTPLSWLASRIYGKLRPWNYGCASETDRVGPVQGARQDTYHPVYGALRWYHRKESGGNPEIAEMFKPICERYFE